MTEEQVTKAIIRSLESAGWTILAFDFPQSGTGRCLHTDDTGSKTEGIWIPDIIAHKGTNLVFFENKSRFVRGDFEKLERIRKSSCYNFAIKKIAEGYHYDNIFYGVGFPQDETDNGKAAQCVDMVDFVLLVGKDGLRRFHDPNCLFG